MILYRHIRLDKNEPFYIGIGKKEKRAYEKNGRNEYWINIVNKSEYRVDILFDDLTLEEACEKEKEFIQLYGRKDLGTGTLVNMTNGGEYLILTKEIRLKRGEKLKGRPCSEDTKRKISQSSKGRRNSDEAINQMKVALTGRKLSEEHIKNLSKSLKGKKLGQKYTEETKNKMSESAQNRKYKKIGGIKKYILSNGDERFSVQYYYKYVRYFVGTFLTYDEAVEALFKHKDELKIKQQ
jgi:hypothetical protein